MLGSLCIDIGNGFPVLINLYFDISHDPASPRVNLEDQKRYKVFGSALVRASKYSRIVCALSFPCNTMQGYIYNPSAGGGGNKLLINGGEK